MDEHRGAAFLRGVFGSSTEKPVFVCSLINVENRNDGRADERFVTSRQLDEIAAFATKWDLAKRGVYWCVSTLVPSARRRTKDNLAEINCLHADLDFKTLDASPDEVRRGLREAMCPPPHVTPSGHGLHPLWLFKEALPATTETIAEVEHLLRRLVELFGADRAAAECSRLLRLPGTHNTKHGEWIEVVTEVYEPERCYEVDDLRDWLELVPVPLLRRRAVAKTNGGDANPWLAAAHRLGFKPPVDVERRLAAMQYQGAGDAAIHLTQLSVSASMLAHGSTTDEVVELLLAATRAAAGDAGRNWNWDREERDIRGMCASWLKKHPEPANEPPPGGSTEPPPAELALHWHGEVSVADSRPMLVADLLPEVGKGLISGQWGTYKTFTFLDLAAAVMAGKTFINFPVVRRGGVLLIAAEGAADVPARLQAVLDAKYSEI